MSAIRRGASCSHDPAVAAHEIAQQLRSPKTTAAVLFCSAHYDLDVLASELSKRFDDIELIGCTTAGEIALDGYQHHSIAGLSFPSDDYIVVAQHIENLSASSLLRVCGMVQSLLRTLRLRAPGANAEDTFALLLIDGLSGIEEPVLGAINRELGDIPLVGGSAGDNLRLRETAIFHGGSFRTASAVLALIHTSVPFQLFKTQHIVSSDTKMVITEADPVHRLVTEINAEPAGQEYARLFGVEGQPFQPTLLATHPVAVRVGGDDYVRSIQRVNEDGSITFYSAIDEGLVLSAARRNSIVADLDKLFTGLRRTIGQPDAILGFDCILRRLELRERRLEESVSKLLADNNVIGFSTYGEQFHAMHLNQTFTGIAFGNGFGHP